MHYDSSFKLEALELSDEIESEGLLSSWAFHTTHLLTGDPYASIKVIHTSLVVAASENL